MKLTPEQLTVVLDSQNRVVSSCPGSGKTRTIVAKVLQCMEAVRGTPRRVGCITLTNAATHEVSTRLIEQGNQGDDDYYEINTIHSFCLNNVVRPFAHLLPELKNGFEIATPDSIWFVAAIGAILRKYDLSPHLSEPLSGMQRRVDGSFVVPNGIPAQAAEELAAMIQAAGYLTFADIIYYALRVVTEHEHAARSLSCRFAWLLVDEFQDTSEVQCELLLKIHEAGHTKFFVVGDENQSIFGFAGAKPNLMREFGEKIGARADVSLSGNFRCSEAVVTVAEKLCTRVPKMAAVGPNKNCPEVPVYQHFSSPAEAIIGSFLPTLARLDIALGSAAILAPWWVQLYGLSKILRPRGVPVVGPGARPYKRSLEFAQFAEAAASHSFSPTIESSLSVHRALFFLLLQLNGEPCCAIYTYRGKCILSKLLGAARERYRLEQTAIGWLERFRDDCLLILTSEALLSVPQAAVLRGSVGLMIEGIRKESGGEELTVDELGIFARPRDCLSLMTLHSSKGKEFDAVAVIDFHDDKVPHFSAKSLEEIAEARRLSYVACTRARKVLMFFSDNSHYRNRPSRFLGPNGMQLCD
ncbi:ATP-dependent DNA helicase Rep [compost metagenome]